MLLDLKLTPSNLFIRDPLPEGVDPPEGLPELLEFNWHCVSGIAVNIQLVKEEFCKERNLRPMKVFL